MIALLFRKLSGACPLGLLVGKSNQLLMGRKPPRHFRKTGNDGVKFAPFRLIVLSFVDTGTRPAKYGFPELAGRKFYCYNAFDGS